MSTTVELVRANERYARLRAAVEAIHVPSSEHPAYSSLHGATPTCAVCVKIHGDDCCENESWPCPTLRALLAAVDS